ncbi:Carboxy-terminal processing protease CtpB precursor [Symmachiella dynata]|uniref:S41 family peptidase n=1 Tax=Symmachiella dynata TaxID=2527995 RepID=UPI00118A2FE2|nr:S41 family peptidase [Symmachiella dynata]QDT47154.1 Carboxy-terminal processing protease CtpB precursor [Symmachiella dynata]
MRLRSKIQLAALLLLIASTASWPGLSGFADSARGTGVSREIQQEISTGRQLEASRQWLDAIEHYEKAAKQWPDNKSLKLGLRRSKFQFSIVRRYSDKSFRESMLRLQEAEALQIYDELSQTIERRYVENIGPTSIVAHGTESLWLALQNKKFLQTNIPNADKTRVTALCRLLRESYWNKPVRYHGQARQVILEICKISQARLGLRSAPIIMEYVFGSCNALDDYSSYLTPGRLKDLFGNIDGEFVGLGIEMKAELGKGMLLVNVLPDSPADAGGLTPGEYIVSIDGTDCRNMSTDEAAERLQGASGSRVILDIQGAPGTRLRQGTFIRRAVSIKSFPIVKMVDPSEGIGYIQMTGFQRNSTRELDAALRKLQQQGMRALIWDVRGNPGGLLDQATSVLDRFIDNGVLVSTRGRNGQVKDVMRATRPGTWRMPLVVLIDGNSASASEIVAGAIRDHHRGTLVGRKTYGKWSVQEVMHTRGNAGLRLTIAKFYSPSGRNHAKVGVSPDIEVPEPDQSRTYYRSPTDLNVAGDSDLQAGLRALRRQMAQR